MNTNKSKTNILCVFFTLYDNNISHIHTVVPHILENTQDDRELNFPIHSNICNVLFHRSNHGRTFCENCLILAPLSMLQLYL